MECGVVESEGEVTQVIEIEKMVKLVVVFILMFIYRLLIMN